MNAPEIIFLPIVNMGVEDGECIAPMWWNKDKTAEHSEAVKAIGYVRKDLLFEWLENKVSLSYGVATDAFVEVIDKINSL